MRNLILLATFLFLSIKTQAQDSAKVFNHEIGFNTVLLIKQIISNNPGNTLEQLPYSIFYNLYHKDKVGLRLGLGLFKSTNETEVEGQTLPRTTETTNLNFRIGASYNFVKHNRITLNVFGDYVIERFKAETINTTTVQSFPNPIQKMTVTSTELTNGLGAQVGVGVKFNLYKHLSLYAEVPVTVISRKMASEVLITENGIPDEKTTVKSSDSSTSITLPTTLYLVLRF